MTNSNFGEWVKDHDVRTKGCYVCLEETLKPLLVSMKILGLYADPVRMYNKVANLEDYVPQKKPNFRSSLISKVYSVVVLVMLWLNLLRCFYAIFPLDAGLFVRTMNAVWYSQCTLNGTVMFVACQKLNLLSSFYKHVDTMYGSKRAQMLGCSFVWKRKFLIIAVAVGWVVVACNLAFMCTIVYGNLNLSRYYIENIVKPFANETWAVIVVIVLQVFASGAWAFPLIFLTIMCRIIRNQFHSFSSSIQKHIQGADDRIPSHLAEIRKRFMQLCQGVDILNGAFKWMLGISFVLEVFLACFISYQMIHTSFDVTSLLMSVFWLLMPFAYILALGMSTSDVHNAAHALVDHLFLCGTKDATVEQLGQLQLFVAKLTGTSVGFTAVDFFVIKKEFLLTMAGLYVTYFFILVQFKI